MTNDPLASPTPLRVVVLALIPAGPTSTGGNSRRLETLWSEGGHVVTGRAAVADDDHAIQQQVAVWLKTGRVDVLLTTDESDQPAGELPPNISVQVRQGVTAQTQIRHDDMAGFYGLIDLR